MTDWDAFLTTWATPHIDRLQRGESVEFRPRGTSMRGKVEDGELVRVAPATTIAAGDVVLVLIGRSVYLHEVKATDGDRYQIGNMRGHINGWVARDAIYGTVIAFPERC